ncbi:CBS domain-containing protein [Nitrospira japonica]|nr:CBS domain-containing protein [Nitrospira japonica]
MDRMTSRRRRGGLYLESTEAEQLGVLPGEERRVKDVMDRHLAVIPPASDLAQATEVMQQRQVTSLIVGEESAPMGLLTDRDLAMQLTRAEPQRARTVGEVIAGRQTLVCHEDDILGDALSAMKDRQLSSLPVVNGRGIVVGMLSPLEVASAAVPTVTPAWTEGMRQPETMSDQRGQRKGGDDEGRTVHPGH